MQTASTELYFKPSFFSSVFSGSHLDTFKDICSKYDRGVFDQYTDIKKISNESICSKFKQIRYIPLSNGDLDYQSDVWDFSSYSISNNPHSILHFETVCMNFRTDVSTV